MNTPTISIQPLLEYMIPLLVDAFDSANWPKPAAIFEQYLQEQTENQRLVWIAMKQEQIAGYITLKWRSLYPPFQQQDIPEIMDFNVLPQFRRQGIGIALLLCAEQHAFKDHETIGLGVGLYADYGRALQIYIKHGYKPDGRGITHHYQTVNPGSSVCLDDDLVLWFSKNRSLLKQTNASSIQSIHNSPHYTWGNDCDGWWLQHQGKFTVISERMPPNTAEQAHFHKLTDQFFYCLSGELWIQINHKTLTLKAHDRISVPAGIPHQVKNNSSTDAQFLVVSSPDSHHDRIDLEI